MAMRVELLAVALLAPAIAFAQAPKEQWVGVGKHVDGSPVEVDKASITRSNGSLIRVWWRIAYAAPRKDGTLVERQQELIDCGRALTATLATVSLDGSGRTLKQSREPDSAALDRLSPATPGTTGDMIAAAACNLVPQNARRR